MPFAKPEDVQDRLGRPLSSAEEGVAKSVIATVTALIVDCADRDEAWADALDPVPPTLTALCVEKVIGAIANPLNLAAQSQSLGAYSKSQTFPRSADVGVFLSPFEERQVSRAVYGTTSGSALPKSVLDREIEMVESPTEEIDEAEPAA